jgi:hypothetical protein
MDAVIREVPFWTPQRTADWLAAEGFPTLRRVVEEQAIDGEALLTLQPADIRALFDLDSPALNLKVAILARAYEIHRSCRDLENRLAFLLQLQALQS